MIMHIIDADGQMLGDIDLTGTLWRIEGRGIVNVNKIDIPDPQPGKPVKLQFLDHSGHELECFGECTVGEIKDHGWSIVFWPGGMVLDWMIKENVPVKSVKVHAKRAAVSDHCPSCGRKYEDV